MVNANDPAAIPYVIEENGFWYVAYKEKNPYVPYLTVSEKGVANGLSTEYNDGYDFGPDSYNPNVAGSYGNPPYSQTSGIQEALTYSPRIWLTGTTYYLTKPVILPDASITIKGATAAAPTSLGGSLTAPLSQGATVFQLATNAVVSDFPNGMIYGSFSNYVKVYIENITFNHNGQAVNGLNLNNGTTNQQSYAYIFNVSSVNSPTGTSGIVLTMYNTTIQQGFASGYGISINYNYPNSDIWIIDFDDFTVGGMVLSGVNCNVIRGIQQQINLGTSASLTVDTGSFSNAFAPYCIYASGSPRFIYMRNTSVILPSPQITSSPTNGFIYTASGQTIGLVVLEDNQVGITASTTSLTFFNSISSIGKIMAHRNTFSVPVGTSLPTFTGFPFSLLLNSQNNAFYTAYWMTYTPAVSIPANPPVSGTIYQNTNPYDINILLPVYATTAATAGTVAYGISASSTVTEMTPKFVSGSTSSVAVDIVTLRVPAGWYYEFTGSGVTFGTAAVQAV